MPDDAQLLRRYAQENSEAAFRQLAERYLDLVYSAALRQLGGDAHRAQDVAQVVFCALARKASALTTHPFLAGWLYSATYRAAASVARNEARRFAREQKAAAMNEVLLSSPEQTIDWDRVRPVLDEAMQRLSESDREAVLLRYFAHRPFAEIGAALKLTEDAARMRVDRALEKLQAQFRRRGITSPASALAAVLSSEAVGAAPAGLLATVSAYAVATAKTASGGAILATWFSMSMSKAIISAVAIAAIGSTLYEIGENHRAATALAALTRERDAMAKRADTEQAQNRLLQARIAARDRSKNISPKAAQLQSLVRDPAYRKLQAVTVQGREDRRFAPLFKTLGLDPDQLAQFKQFLAERQLAAADAAVAARDQGMAPGPNSGWGQAIFEAAASVDAQIKTTLGDEVYGQFQHYVQTLPERAVVEQLQTALSYTAAPLTDDQVNQLIQILQQAASASPLNNGNEIIISMANGLAALDSPPYTVSDQAAVMAKSILSPEQMRALQQIQSQQQAQRQMSLLAGGNPPP